MGRLKPDTYRVPDIAVCTYCISQNIVNILKQKNMKAAIWIVAIVVIGFFFYKYAFAKLTITTAPIEQKYDTTRVGKPINVVYFQDGTASIVRNGIELVSSQVFAPYYND